jgi:hypothetical protein
MRVSGKRSRGHGNTPEPSILQRNMKVLVRVCLIMILPEMGYDVEPTYKLFEFGERGSDMRRKED